MGSPKVSLPTLMTLSGYLLLEGLFYISFPELSLQRRGSHWQLTQMKPSKRPPKSLHWLERLGIRLFYTLSQGHFWWLKKFTIRTWNIMVELLQISLPWWIEDSHWWVICLLQEQEVCKIWQGKIFFYRLSQCNCFWSNSNGGLLVTC